MLQQAFDFQLCVMHKEYKKRNKPTTFAKWIKVLLSYFHSVLWTGVVFQIFGIMGLPGLVIFPPYLIIAIGMILVMFFFLKPTAAFFN